MSDISVKIENVSKKYLIGADNRFSNETLTERLSSSISAIFKGNLQGQTKEFWALKDVNLNIKKGDRVGLIGHNGAGKSTLLKILSQITEPTTGRISLHGKVSSLLEVGTGFHQELTGYENIFLNGSIIGMSKKDVTNKLDEIVEFAGISDFLYTPVKRYSSGMIARLGFAVASHLQSDILIVDEILAVGDIKFQKKCIGKMEEVSQSHGKTVLFVSHNLGAVKNLCNKAALLNGGSCIFYGSVNDAISKYVNSINSDVKFIKYFIQNNRPVQLIKATICKGNDPCELFGIFEDVCIKIEYQVREKLNNISFFLEIMSGNEVLFCSMEAGEKHEALDWKEIGYHETLATIPAPLLRSGFYSVNLYLGTPLKKPIEKHLYCLGFNIFNDLVDTDYSSYSSQRKGNVNVPVKWNTKSIKNK